MISRVKDGQDWWECQVMALVVNWCSIKWAHWQKESLDFSLWISPLPGDIPSIMYFLLINFGFPLCQCEHLVSRVALTQSSCQSLGEQRSGGHKWWMPVDASGECRWTHSDLKYFHTHVIIFIQVGICQVRICQG